MDIIARTLGQPVARALGQNVVVDNRPGGGGGGVIGTEVVARAPADGHTVLFIGNGFTMNPALRSKLPYNTAKDFTGLARVASNPLVVSVHPSLPAKTLKQLVALARARPGELTFASGTAAGGLRLNAERFKAAAGIDIVNVPYQGGVPAVTAVMGGHTSILMVNVSETVPHVASGRLRPLAVTSLERNGALKEVPTVAESGYAGFEALMWYGVVARSAAPKGAIDRLSAEIDPGGPASGSERRPGPAGAFRRHHAAGGVRCVHARRDREQRQNGARPEAGGRIRSLSELRPTNSLILNNRSMDLVGPHVQHEADT